MGIELDAWLPDRYYEQQLSPWREYASQLGHGRAVAIRVERVAIAAEADVLDHVHARQRGDAAAGKG